MNGTDRTAVRERTERPVWAGYAAAVWALLFGARAVYWGLGGTVGLGTLSPGLQQAAEAGDPEVFAALWAVAALLAAGTLFALVLCRPEPALPRALPLIGGRAVPRPVLLPPAWGAGTLLAVHGGNYVGFLVTAGERTPEVLWYALLWGPWFLLGGVLFMAAGWSHLRRASNRRLAAAASAAGVAGGILAALGPHIVRLVVGETAGP